MQVTFHVPAQKQGWRSQPCFVGQLNALPCLQQVSLECYRHWLHSAGCTAGTVAASLGLCWRQNWWSSPAPSAGWETAALCLLLKVGHQPCWEGRRLRKGRVERQPGERIFWGCHCSGMLAGLVSRMPLRSSDGIHCLHRIACPPSCMCREGTTCIITH